MCIIPPIDTAALQSRRLRLWTPWIRSRARSSWRTTGMKTRCPRRCATSRRASSAARRPPRPPAAQRRAVAVRSSTRPVLFFCACWLLRCSTDAPFHFFFVSASQSFESHFHSHRFHSHFIIIRRVSQLRRARRWLLCGVLSHIGSVVTHSPQSTSRLAAFGGALSCGGMVRVVSGGAGKQADLVRGRSPGSEKTKKNPGRRCSAWRRAGRGSRCPDRRTKGGCCVLRSWSDWEHSIQQRTRVKNSRAALGRTTIAVLLLSRIRRRNGMSSTTTCSSGNKRRGRRMIDNAAPVVVSCLSIHKRFISATGAGGGADDRRA